MRCMVWALSGWRVVSCKLGLLGFLVLTVPPTQEYPKKLSYPPVHEHETHQRVPLKGKWFSRTPQSRSKPVGGCWKSKTNLLVVPFWSLFGPLLVHVPGSTFISRSHIPFSSEQMEVTHVAGAATTDESSVAGMLENHMRV